MWVADEWRWYFSFIIKRRISPCFFLERGYCFIFVNLLPTNMLCNLFCSPTHLYFKRGTNFYLYQEEGKQELAPTSLSLSSTTIVRKERVLRNSHDDSTKIKNAPCQKFLCVPLLLFLFLINLISKTNLEENYRASCSFNF